MREQRTQPDPRPRRSRRALCAAVGLALAAAGAPAGDWPQYRGANRDGKTPESLATTWPATQPRELWRAEVGKGHSPVSVAQGRVVTLGYTGKGDTVWCLDANTGGELWRYDYPATARLKGEPGDGAYDGPHAAPAIREDRVYTLSRNGRVLCLGAAKGDLLWQRDLAVEQEANLPECGFAGSPLLLDGMVIVSVGRCGTALDANTGKTVWHSGRQIAGYGAPTLAAESNGTRHLFFFAYRELISVRPEDGNQRWSLAWPTRWGANVADPVVLGDAVFFSSAYNRGCGLADLSTGQLRWQNRLLNSQASPMILHEGTLYGFDGYINDSMANQSLVCMEARKGTEHWRRKGVGGQMILAGGRLAMLLVNGDLVIANATPKAYEELARARVQEPEQCPVPPTLVGGRLYCRTGKGLLRCLDVAP
jgi:outer membrane protein assembly factor BamB